jgi:hypothetical protein
VAPLLAQKDEYDDNLWALRERLRQLAPDYHIVRHELDPERDGYRRVHLFAQEETLTWPQPWSEEAHRRENTHCDFGPYGDCRARTLTQHFPMCSRATALAFLKYHRSLDEARELILAYHPAWMNDGWGLVSLHNRLWRERKTRPRSYLEQRPGLFA